MPTYDYVCTKCESVQEEFHSIFVKQDILCNKCGSKCKRKISSGNGFILKGGDWPSKEMKLKSDMTKKSARMKDVSTDREKSGEAVKTIADLKNKD